MFDTWSVKTFMTASMFGLQQLSLTTEEQQTINTYRTDANTYFTENYRVSLQVTCPSAQWG
jgi:hypothetical protein